MKLGIVGLPQSGKSTLFQALARAKGDKGVQTTSHSSSRITSIAVSDKRLDFLAGIYKPKKIIHAKLEVILPSAIASSTSTKAEGGIWNQLRNCDAFLLVVRNFNATGNEIPNPESDFQQIEEAMIVSDLDVAEKRIQRIEFDRKKGKRPDDTELLMIQKSCEILNRGEPLRNNPSLAKEPALKGFTFLSAKPILIIHNNGDEDVAEPNWQKVPQGAEMIAVRAKLEKDLADLTADEAQDFLEIYDIKESMLDRMIKISYKLLNRISFFTIGADEVRAWPIEAGTIALEAAGSVHTDMKVGFIRAETLSFQDLKTHGTFKAAKKAGLVRLEGKTYAVKDGDIINFFFNV